MDTTKGINNISGGQNGSGILIGESGGTKTDWCYINQQCEKRFFSLGSLHPNHWGENFHSDVVSSLESIDVPKSASVLVFSAGCFARDKATKLKEYLSLVFSDEIKVFSDLHAAGLSSFGRDNGNVAILGTGSVIFSWTNQTVEQIIGGLGYEKGDEGSGFYFGKLIHEAFKNKELSKQEMEVYMREVDVDRILHANSGIDKKKLLSKTPFRLREFNMLFRSYHEENIRLFLEKYLSKSDIKNLKVVGSYGKAIEEIMIPIFNDYGCVISEVIDRPLPRLVEQIDLFID